MSKKHEEVYLYHYTTTDGLSDIVKNKNIWATDVLYLNDSEEYNGGIKLTKDHLAALQEEALASKNNCEDERLDWLIKEIKKMRIYVCSFSKAKDDLSQWRAYCSKGGFAIGFPRSGLMALAKKSDFVLKECIYESGKQTEMIRAVVDKVMQQEPSLQEILTAGPNAESLIKCTLSGRLIWELARTCPILKNNAFKSEAEWRLISKPRSGGDHDQIRFRTKNGMVIPYKEFLLNDKELWRKVRVTVGPTPHPEESRKSVYQLLRCHTGCAHAVTNTCTPYRDW